MRRGAVRRGALALLTVLAASVGFAQVTGHHRRTHSSSSGGGSGGGGASYTLAYEQRWQLDSGQLPACTTDSTCVGICYSNGSAIVCMAGDGGSLGTVTPGTGATFSALPWNPSLSVQTEVTDSNASSVVATALNSVYGGDHTVVFGGYGRNLNADDFEYFLDQFSATGGLYVRQESGVMSCAWFGDSFGSGTTRQASPGGTAVPRDGWLTGSCRRSGNTYTARVMGNDSTPATVTITSFGTDAKTGYLGRRENPGYPLRGPLAFVAWYSAAKTSAQLDAIDGRFWGSGSVVGGIPALRFTDFDGGVVAAYNSGTKPVIFAGLSLPRGTTNVWGPNALHAAGTAAVGTPTLTPDAGASPFDSWYGDGNGCWMMTDDDGAAFEGSESATAGSADGLYTVSAYLASDVSNGSHISSARLSIVATGGTGSTDCDIPILPNANAPRRYRCTANVAGASAVKGRVLVGNAASATGAIQVCHTQMELGGFPSPPTMNNTAVGDSTAYLPSADLAAWPTGAVKGGVEVVFTPGYNFGAAGTWDGGTSIWATGSEVFNNDDTFYLLDAVSAAPDHELIMWWPGSNTTAHGRLQNPVDGGVNEVSVSAELSKGQQYVERMAWTVSGGLCTLSLYLNTCADAATCHATTRIAGPGSPGTCPVGAYNQAFLLKRYSNAFPTTGYVAAVRVYQ